MRKDFGYILGSIILLLIGVIGWQYFAGTRPIPPTPNGNTIVDNFDKVGNLLRNNPGFQPNVWYLSYEEPGSPARSAKLEILDAKCYSQDDQVSCEDNLTQGSRARVRGEGNDSLVKVTEIILISEIETPTRNISLFYYNEAKDKQIGNGNPACSREAILPVPRTIPLTNTPIQDAIRELIKGDITPAEAAQGFETEFPNSRFKLLGANLRGGVLTLEFTEVPGFTGGGSCRITILANQIIKTAMQFPEVKEVKFKPEELFQP